MKFKNIYSLLGGMLLLSGCAAEAPFPSEREDKDGMGEFRKDALNLDVISGDGINVITRAGEEDININDFKIQFFKGGNLEKTVNYGEMPDVIMLDPGVYRITAKYNEDKDAEWRNPFFEGMSGEFSVTAGSITSDIDPIKCTLKNVKVSIIFDETLKNEMGEDSYIEVKLGNNGPGLKYTIQNEGEAGYFRKGSESTLIATFHGEINGSEVTETKSLQEVTAGTHYKVTFKLHSHNSDNSGDASGSVSVDASVNYENLEQDVTVNDQLLDDESERPSQDDDPNRPNDDDPVNPPATDGPQIIAQDPINLEEWNVNPSACVLKVLSQTGITAFVVDIESDSLTPEELAGVGLAAHLDLVEGSDGDGNDLSGALSGLGFPVKEKVLGQKEVTFNITNFMPLLAALGAGDHTFILKVTDESGTCEKQLRIRIN